MSAARLSPFREDPVPVFAALGDPTRLSLLTKLSSGEQRSIASLASETSLSRQAVTKHLQVLENAQLVSSVRIGRESRFAYRPEPVNDAISFLASLSSQWDEALGRLKALVEEG